MEKALFIRADASERIGTGHVMRCLALAQGWKSWGGKVMFITACESDRLRRRLSGEGFQVITLARAHPDPAGWDSTSQALAAHLGAWVVLFQHHPEWLEINQDVQQKKIGGGCDATESND